MTPPEPDNPFSGLSNLADRAREHAVQAHAAARGRRLAVFGGSLAALATGFLFVFVIDGFRGILISAMGSVMGALFWTLGSKIIPKKAIELTIAEMSREDVTYGILAMMSVGATIGPLAHAGREKWPATQTFLLMVCVLVAGAIGAITTARRVGRSASRSK